LYNGGRFHIACNNTIFKETTQIRTVAAFMV
jgi:hypothetical protein